MRFFTSLVEAVDGLLFDEMSFEFIRVELIRWGIMPLPCQPQSETTSTFHFIKLFYFTNKKCYVLHTLSYLDNKSPSIAIISTSFSISVQLTLSFNLLVRYYSFLSTAESWDVLELKCSPLHWDQCKIIKMSGVEARFSQIEQPLPCANIPSWLLCCNMMTALSLSLPRNDKL